MELLESKAFFTCLFFLTKKNTDALASPWESLIQRFGLDMGIRIYQASSAWLPRQPRLRTPWPKHCITRNYAQTRACSSCLHTYLGQASLLIWVCLFNLATDLIHRRWWRQHPWVLLSAHSRMKRTGLVLLPRAQAHGCSCGEHAGLGRRGFSPHP